MKVLVRHTVLILLVWLTATGACLARDVYLKDGGIIESRSVWRQGDKVFVNVNRDIIAEFNTDEIDLRRTFPKTGAPSRKVRRNVTVAAAAGPATDTAPVAQVPTGAPPGTKPALPAQKPAAPPPPLPAPSVPSPAVVTTPAPQPVAAPAAPALPASSPDKAEAEQRRKQSAEMMADAIQRKDPEQLKKAIEMQKNAMPQKSSVTPMNSGFSVVLLLIVLVVCLLIIAAQWIVFQKAGVAGWKCLIPFYNMYILMEISGKPGWWMFLLFIPLAGVVVYLLAMLSLAKKFRKSELYGVGLFLLPMIFFPLLAFGGAEYEG